MRLMERDQYILAWILHMRFSHLDQIGEKFFPGCNIHRAPYRRMQKLVKAGLVGTQKVYSDPRDLYIPTTDAVTALVAGNYPFAIGVAKDKTFVNYFHDRELVDLRILFEALGIGLWIPERVIRSVKPHGITPDALIMTVDQVYPVEYERTEKDPARYKKIFDRYNYSSKFEKVLYILPSERRIESLKKKTGYVWQKFYFISLEELEREKGDAVFRSSQGELPVRVLMDYSMDGTLADRPREEIKAIVESESMGAGRSRIRRDCIVDYSERDPDDAEDDDYDDDLNRDADDDPEVDPEENDRGGDGADDD